MDSHGTKKIEISWEDGAGMTAVNEFMNGFYILDDGRVRQFLMVGGEEALLVDTGFEDSHVMEAVRTVTSLPVQVIMTHGDRDHTGGVKAFGECFMHPKDWHLVSGDITLHPLKEGDVFSCGGYRLEVIEIPGHTYGSVAFLDREKKLLLPGDSVQKDGPIYMFGSHRNLDLYIESHKKLLERKDEIETILPCHHAYPINTSYIEKNLRDAEALKGGTLQGRPHPSMPCFRYRGQWTEFYYNSPETE